MVAEHQSTPTTTATVTPPPPPSRPPALDFVPHPHPLAWLLPLMPSPFTLDSSDAWRLGLGLLVALYCTGAWVNRRKWANRSYGRIEADEAACPQLDLAERRPFPLLGSSASAPCVSQPAQQQWELPLQQQGLQPPLGFETHEIRAHDIGELRLVQEAEVEVVEVVEVDVEAEAAVAMAEEAAALAAARYAREAAQYAREAAQKRERAAQVVAEYRANQSLIKAQEADRLRRLDEAARARVRREKERALAREQAEAEAKVSTAARLHAAREQYTSASRHSPRPPPRDSAAAKAGERNATLFSTEIEAMSSARAEAEARARRVRAQEAAEADEARVERRAREEVAKHLAARRAEEAHRAAQRVKEQARKAEEVAVMNAQRMAAVVNRRNSTEEAQQDRTKADLERRERRTSGGDGGGGGSSCGGGGVGGGSPDARSSSPRGGCCSSPPARASSPRASPPRRMSSPRASSPRSPGSPRKRRSSIISSVHVRFTVLKSEGGCPHLPDNLSVVAHLATVELPSAPISAVMRDSLHRAGHITEATRDEPPRGRGTAASYSCELLPPQIMGLPSTCLAVPVGAALVLRVPAELNAVHFHEVLASTTFVVEADRVVDASSSSSKAVVVPLQQRKDCPLCDSEVSVL